MKYLAYILLILALAAILLATGCGCDDDDDDDDPSGDDDDDDNDTAPDDDDDVTWPDDADELIQQGKDWLAVPDGDRARLYFMDALELVPGHPEALYGVVISDLVHTTDVVSIVVDYVMSVLDYGGPVKGKEADADDLINGMLQTMLDGLLRERALELIEYADLAAEAEATFEHPGIPIYIHYENVCTLSTEFDYGELWASAALAGILDGALYHLYSVDLDFDLSHAFRLVETIDFDQVTTEEAVAAVVEVLLDVLTDPGFPDFLTIPEENAEIAREAGMEVGNGLDKWLWTFDAINAETDDQADDAMGYVDLNGNHKYDPNEPYVIPHFEQLDAAQMDLNQDILEMVVGLRNTFWDYTEMDVDPNNPNPFRLKLITPLVEYAGLPGWIIPDMTLDIGAWYLDPAGSGLKDTLIIVLRIVDLFLDDYEW